MGVAGIFAGVLTLGLALGLARGDPVLQDNGYEGVVVVIGEEVPEDTRIIDNIKRMFQDGSKVLDEATGHRAHFSQVTIVVPSSWSPQPHYQSEGGGVGVRERRADILVDLPHPLHGHTPYTLQLGGCGDPGEYVHLSTDYATHMYGELGQAYGPPGKVLVHEWAHYRWGVFDEYPAPHAHAAAHTPPFYVGDDGMVRATGCSLDIVGWVRTASGGECHAAHSGLPDDHCHFYPAHNNTATASLMGPYYLESVKYFCDNVKAPHNPLAPTPHNLLCGGRSVWAVIEQHEDFSGDRNPPRRRREAESGKEQEEDLKPEFVVVQERREEGGVMGGVQVKDVSGSEKEETAHDGMSFVLLLDLSASMEPTMDQLYQAVVGFVRYLVPAGTKMAVVSFANRTRLDLPFTLVPEGPREKLVAALPTTWERDGYTAIGSAVEFALELMETEGQVGGSMVLVTDGDETMYPLVSSVLPRLKQARLPLSTVSFGPYATDSLEVWASETGGRSYYHSPGGGGVGPGEGLASILYEAVSHALPRHAARLVQVHRDSHPLQWDVDVEGEVVLDSSLGHHTHFTFTQAFTHHTKFSVVVEIDGPDGVRYGDWSDRDTYHADTTTRTIAFTIPHAQAGVWRYRVRRGREGRPAIPIVTEVGVLVTSYPRPTTHHTHTPVSVEARVVGGRVTYPSAALVVARVRQGRSPVLNATATALVVPPTPHTPLTISLTDDGQGGDREAGDGVYSGYFTQFSGDGRYSLSVTVTANDMTAALAGDQLPDVPSTVTSTPTYSAAILPSSTSPSHSSSSTSNPSSHYPSSPSHHHHHHHHRHHPPFGSSAMQPLPLPLPEDSLPAPTSAFNPRNLKPPLEVEGGKGGEGKEEGRAGEREEEEGGVRGVNTVNKVERFSRVVSGGIFKVRNYVAGDLQAPGMVKDLRVLKIDAMEATVTLAFTSTGDDKYTGTASILDLRYHYTSLLVEDFSRGYQVEEHHLTFGDLTPKPAGDAHTLTLKLPEDGVHGFGVGEGVEGRVVFFMLRARDETGNSGVPSNLATAYFPPRLYVQKQQEEERLEALSGLMVLVVLAVVILALLAFTCSLKYLHARRKQRRVQDLGEGGVTLRGGERNTVRGAERGTVRSVDRGNLRSTVRSVDRGLERGTGRGIERGTVRSVSAYGRRSYCQ